MGKRKLRTFICQWCGKEYRTYKRLSRFCSSECKCHGVAQRPDDTKCWGCKKATGFCSWSEKFIPIEGWKATPTKVKISNRWNGEVLFTDSFIVHECPLFERG